MAVENRWRHGGGEFAILALPTEQQGTIDAVRIIQCSAGLPTEAVAEVEAEEVEAVE